ncbi:MAG: ABC transporter ATP-binding protein [Bryobacterales bacterium]
MKKVIAFENVSKAYRLGEGRSGIRDAITATGKRLLSKEKRSSQPVLMALNDVSFDVNQGEAVGVVGPNGAGKTTVMKLLSRITKATSGKVRSSGRVSSLIELGAGFHPDLTGRENIFLNGTILGMSRAEIRQRFEEIIDFSGLDGFLDTPVKRYSSGMYARLAFSVAAHTGADILLVDEVLAVGDLGFKRSRRNAWRTWFPRASLCCSSRTRSTTCLRSATAPFCSTADAWSRAARRAT